MAKEKKYEITIDGLTVDFRKVLCGDDEYKWHEKFCNSFMNLIDYVVRLAGKIDDGIIRELELELFCRAYNYMRKGRGYDAHTGIAFGNALLAKVQSYRDNSLRSSVVYDYDKDKFVVQATGELIDPPIYSKR